jgi:SSS family solute:Na+ symporter
MKAIATCIIFVFMIPYSASIYQGLTYLFESTFHIPFWVALLIITVFTSIYIMIGGYKAVARVDFLQGIIMFVGAILMVTFLVSKFDGLSNILERINSIRAERMALDPSLPLAIKPPLSVWILPGLIFMTSFGVWGLPQMVHKYYAIKDERQIFRGALVTTVFAFVVVGGAYFAGTMCPLMDVQFLLPEGAEKVNIESLVPTLLTNYLPPFMMAIILLLVLSASISTLTSLVLVSASAVTIDLYKGYLNPNATQGRMLLLMRVLSALFIVASFVVTISKVTWIITLMSVSWGAIAGAFMAPFMYGLFWKRTTKAGAYVGMFTGLILSNGLFFGCLFLYDLPHANAFSALFASIAMIVPFVVVPIVSLMTKPPKHDTIDKAFEKNTP